MSAKRTIVVATLSPERGELFGWLSKATHSSSCAGMLATLTHYAIRHPEWTFWQVLAEVRRVWEAAK